METSPRQIGATGAILCQTRDFLRWLAFLLLVTAAAGLLLLYVVQARLDEQIRTFIEVKFQEHYSNLVVRVRSARRLPHGGIEVRGLSIFESRPDGPPAVMAYVDELLIDCDTSLTDLVAEDLAVRRLVVRRLLLRPTRDVEGIWNVEQLFPLPQFGKRPPPAFIESATIEITDDSSTEKQHWVLREVDLQVTPQIRPVVAGHTPAAPLILVRGGLTSESFRRADVAGRFDFASGHWELSGSLENLMVSSQTVDQLPANVRDACSPLRSLRGNADIDFRVNHAPGEMTPWGVAAAGLFTGQMDDPRLPRPLRDVRVTFRGDDEGLYLDRLTARTGDTILVGSGTRAGWKNDSRLRIQLRAERFVLDQSLRSTLQAEWRDVWEKLSPAGIIDADVALMYDGQHWAHDIVIDCHDVSFAYAGFPYRMTNATGRIHCRNGVLKCEELQALASGRVVLISGQMRNPGPQGVGWIEISVDQPIPIEERLIAALPERGRKVVRDMQPHGMVTVWFRFERPVASQSAQKQIRIGLHDCSVRYAKFRYPIHQIHGKLTMRDDHWSFQELEGVNDSAVILCHGSWVLDGRGGSNLDLRFDARDVPLEDELRDALKSDPQKIWKMLRPRGTIDQLQVAVQYQSTDKQLNVEVTGHKLRPGQNVEGRSITLYPTFLPYQWDNVVGTVRLSGGRVEILNLVGHHDNSSVKLQGVVDTPSPQTWRVALSQLNVDGLLADHVLTSALPPALGNAVAKMEITDPVAVSGWLELSGLRGDTAPKQSRWQLDFDIENGRINCGVPLEHVHGGVTLEGAQGPSGLLSRGWIDIDSMIYKGVQVTRVEGPLQLNAERLAIGQWNAPNDNGDVPRPIRGKALGGTAAITAQIWFRDGRFEMDATFNDGDLAVISREATSQQHSISGRTFATVRLYGTGSGLHTLRGQGQVQLREADLYELPVMVRLLKILRIRPPDETAFNSSDVAFRTEGDRIYFDRIDFDGDAISLEGRGEMNLDRVLNLTFDTFVGRDDDQPLSILVRPLLKEAGRRLMVTRVTGTLEDPHVERIALPDVNQGFQQVFTAAVGE